MSNIRKTHRIKWLFLSILIVAPSLSYATLYDVSGNFWGQDGAEVNGSLNISQSFSSSIIETSWQDYLTSQTHGNFYLELEYQISSFDLYNASTGQSFFKGKEGFIEVIVTGQPTYQQPNSTWYCAWGMAGTGSIFNVYSGRYGDDVVFINNGTNVLDCDYDLLPQMIELGSAVYNNDVFGTLVDLTLTKAVPVPEPSSLLLFGLGAIALTVKRKFI